MSATNRTIRFSTFRSARSRIPAARELKGRELLWALTHQRPTYGPKDGPALSPAVFRPGGTRRKVDALQSQLLIYDLDGPKCFDSKKNRFKLDLFGTQRPTQRQIDAWLADHQRRDPLRWMLQRTPFAGCYYSSWSHGWAKAYSYRIVFLLNSPLKPEPWRALWGYVFEQLGGETVGLDPRCSDICRLYYAPSLSDTARSIGLRTPWAAAQFPAQAKGTEQLVNLISQASTPARVRMSA